MGSCRRNLAVLLAVALVVLGGVFSLWAFLGLVVFAEGPAGPRAYSPEEKAHNRVIGGLHVAGALASFAGAAVLLGWGFRGPPADGDAYKEPR